jgi:hypothetical protein
MVPRLEDPVTPEHLAYHLSTWHAEGHFWVTVTDDNFRQWQGFHDRLPHPAGASYQQHTHTGWHQ